MSQVTEQSVRFQTALASIKRIQASAVLDLTEDDFDFLTSNKVWIATDRSRARQIGRASCRERAWRPGGCGGLGKRGSRRVPSAWARHDRPAQAVGGRPAWSSKSCAALSH